MKASQFSQLASPLLWPMLAAMFVPKLQNRRNFSVEDEHCGGAGAHFRTRNHLKVGAHNDNKHLNISYIFTYQTFYADTALLRNRI